MTAPRGQASRRAMCCGSSPGVHAPAFPLRGSIIARISWLRFFLPVEALELQSLALTEARGELVDGIVKWFLRCLQVVARGVDLPPYPWGRKSDMLSMLAPADPRWNIARWSLSSPRGGSERSNPHGRVHHRGNIQCCLEGSDIGRWQHVRSAGL